MWLLLTQEVDFYLHVTYALALLQFRRLCCTLESYAVSLSFQLEFAFWFWHCVAPATERKVLHYQRKTAEIIFTFSFAAEVLLISVGITGSVIVFPLGLCLLFVSCCCKTESDTQPAPQCKTESDTQLAPQCKFSILQ